MLNVNGLTANVFSFFTKKINETRTHTRSEYPVITQDYIYEYGVKQKYADCHASIKRDNYRSQDEFEAAVRKALDDLDAALKAGKVGKAESGSATTLAKKFTAVASEADKLALLRALQAELGVETQPQVELIPAAE